VILAVKPWLSGIVLEEIRSELDYGHQLLISIVSGLSFDKMVEILCNEHKKPPVLFRLIPNTAIGVCRSMTFISSFGASTDQVSLVESLFNELGVTMLVEERMMPACTSLSSCGIAYAFRYIRAAMSGGVELGISAEQSKSIVLQTLRGAVSLLESTGSHPEIEIDRVTTPGGITIRGLNEMERCGFTSSVISGLKASV
jgi:pyrroline-5-carboxylate reductase